MKTERQQAIAGIVGSMRVGTQQELVEQLERRGIEATQSSVSRDIVEMGLTKMNGYYAVAAQGASRGPRLEIDTAGANLLVIKTEVGQAQPVALAIDRAGMAEIIGTVAGDDTILVAVKTRSAQRAAINKIKRLFNIL
ncbi:MAG TPA: arginine repressor [Blastocatellia bacterium]|jgi:transcriptional regulator of arginine metabolism